MRKIALLFVYPTQKAKTMTTYDPLYGELFSAKEVVNLTGLTQNQLRNWRLPARQDKAPFGFVMIGLSPHYRKVVVEAWLERNGGANRKYVPVGLDHEFPISQSLTADSVKREHLSVLAGITTSNFWLKWYQEMFTLYGTEYTNYLRDNQRRIYATFAKVSPDSLEHLVNSKRADNFEQYYYGNTMATRAFYALKNNWDIAEHEIISLPVGEIPPTKETK